MPDLPSSIVTFLFTDIEGSTRLWEQYPEAMRKALVCHAALLREAIERHHGHVFKTLGDAFCAAFPTADQALQAALSAQQALKAQTWEEIGALRVRIALHTGLADVLENDYLGPALNRAARLLSIGHGEQVLLSLPAREGIRERLPQGCRLKDLGRHRLKDLSEPEHVFQLVAPGLPTDFPPLLSLPACAHNLPVALTSFIGRETEMQEIKRLLETTPLLTLAGAGGCGKTRLALQVAVDLMEAYPEGVWLVELASLSDPALAAQALATALGVSEEPGRALTQTLVNTLQAGKRLIVLDNCEHLLAACARLAECLLRACPRLCILATSRQGLGVHGEQVYRVPPLSSPDPRHLPAHEKDLPVLAAEYEAVRLFVERARLHRADFALTADNVRAVSHICHCLDGIPLAIELAAARILSLTAGQIAARLDDRFSLLTGCRGALLPHQQTLKATLDWSYDLLTAPEKRLLARLSVFAGGWTLEAAEQVTGYRGQVTGGEDFSVTSHEVLDLLTSLVDKSLVLFEERAGDAEGRYSMLETIRQYGLERLTEMGEEVALRGRHRDTFLALAEAAEPHLRGSQQAAWLERLEAEHANLRAALEWCFQEADGAVLGLRLAGALRRFWLVRGHWSEGHAYLLEALAREGTAECAEARAKALNGAGMLTYVLGDYAAARELYEQGLDIGQTSGNRQAVAYALNGLGLVAMEQGDYAEAQRLYEEGLTLNREVGDKEGMALSLIHLGITACLLGDYGSATKPLVESLALFRELGDKWGIAYALLHVGNVVYKQGDHETARARLEESLAIRRELGDKSSIHHSLHHLGSVARDQGDYPAARALLAESLTIRQELGDKGGIASSLDALARLAVREGQPDRAARLWGAVEALREGIGAPLPPNEREEYARDLAAAQEALSERAFALAWEQGRGLTLEQAIAHALQESQRKGDGRPAEPQKQANRRR